MKLTLILNADIPLSRAMNALAQMVFGMGHRLEGQPDINLFFGNTEQVRLFRTRSSMLASEQRDSALASDFPHTMVGASTAALLAKVVETPESEIIYYGAAYLTEETDEALDEITRSCDQLANYIPHASEDRAHLLPFCVDIAGAVSDSPKKIIMVINKFPLSEVLNSAVLVGLELGRKVPVDDQYLLNLAGAEYSLSMISYHSNVILKADRAKHSTMAQSALDTPGLMSATIKYEGVPAVTVAFGDTELLECVFSKRLTRLFGDTLSEGDLVPVRVDVVSRLGF